MNIKIDLKEDDALRAEVKDMIKGQVLSIIRNEMQLIVKELISAKINDDVIKLIDERIAKMIMNAIAKESGGKSEYQIHKYIKNRFDSAVLRYIYELLEPIVK
jgi:hypothetical protein